MTTVKYETGYVISIDPALGEDDSACVVYDRKTGKIVDQKEVARKFITQQVERHMLDKIHSVFGIEEKTVQGEVVETEECSSKKKRFDVLKLNCADFESTEKDRWAIEGECLQMQDQKLIGKDEI